MNPMKLVFFKSKLRIVKKQIKLINCIVRKLRNYIECFLVF